VEADKAGKLTKSAGGQQQWTHDKRASFVFVSKAAWSYFHERPLLMTLCAASPSVPCR